MQEWLQGTARCWQSAELDTYKKPNSHAVEVLQAAEPKSSALEPWGAPRVTTSLLMPTAGAKCR